MHLLRLISLAALCFGTCIAALDGSVTHSSSVLVHQARRGLAARHTVQELREVRESLSPEAQSFFDQIVAWITRMRESVNAVAPSPDAPTKPKPTAERSSISSTSTTSLDDAPTPTPEAPKETRSIVTVTRKRPTSTKEAPSSTPAPVAKPTQSPSKPDSFQSSALAAHNDFRANHGAQPLSWSTKLEDAARKWGNVCEWRHSQGAVGPFGENLAIMSGTNNNVAQAIKMWNDEAPDYNPGNPVASHFTQVVWKDTTELGCAVVACNIASFAGGATSNFYVCEYNPPGNVFPARNFAENVEP